MDPVTDKYHVVGVGCASAVPLVRLVIQSLANHPGKKALIVAADSMSGLMTRATPSDERAKTVGSAIFGDGCAAAVIEKGTSGPAVTASTVHQIKGRWTPYGWSSRTRTVTCTSTATSPT